MKQSGSGDKIIDAGVVIAAIFLFFKTSDVLAYFAPKSLSDIIGMDIGWLYGLLSALLVEGLALTLHFNHRARLSPSAQAVKWTLLAISGACQVFDGFITQNAVAQMSEALRFTLAYGVPLIPLIIMVMIFGIGKLPELDQYGQVKEEAGFAGVVPTFRKLIYGTPSQPKITTGRTTDEPTPAGPPFIPTTPIARKPASDPTPGRQKIDD